MSFGLATIRRFLMDDADSTPPTASQVSAANLAYWPTAGDVPRYTYTTLDALWLISNTGATALGNTIGFEKGEVANNSTQSISLITKPTPSYVIPESFKDNDPGAMDFYMNIIYSLPQGQASFDRLTQTRLRVRYLLDHLWRQRRRGVSPLVKVTPSVDKIMATSDGLRCQYLSDETACNGQLVVESWAIHQTIVVPKI